MRTFLRGRAKLLVLAFAVVLAVPSIALAANIIRDQVVIDSNSDMAAGQVRNYTAGSAATSITYWIQATNGCDAADGTAVTVEPYVSGYPAGASQSDVTISPSSQEFGGCASGANDINYAKAFSFSTAEGVTPGRYTIDVNYSDVGGQSYQTNLATFYLDVSAPNSGGGGGGGGSTNTAPQVSVAGVANGASYEIGSVPPATCQVTDAEDGNSSFAATLSNITGSLAAYGLGSRTASCSYTDSGGLGPATASATYSIVDTGAPTITDLGLTDPSKVSGTAGSHGWYTSEVTNTFRASDTGAGFATTPPPLLLQYDFTRTTADGVEGSAVKVASGDVFDVANNKANSIDSQAFKIDLNDPSIGVGDGNSASANVCTGSAPTRPSFNPTDTPNGSGIDPANTGETWTPPSNPLGLGTYTYEAHATDIAGRTASYGPKSYGYTYGVGQAGGASYSGVLQPVNQDGSSRFKLGSTVPVKFTLTCGGTPITNAVPKLTVKQGDTKPDPGVEEAISTSAATTGNAFRLVDASTGMYLFNLSTKSGYLNPGETQPIAFSQGTWTLGINFGDNTSQTVKVQLVR